MAKDTFVNPVSASIAASTVSGIALQEYRVQSVLINSLMSNAFSFWLFALGCFALALGLGRVIYKNVNPSDLGSVASFGIGGFANLVFPFAFGNYIMANVYTFGSTMDAVTSSYVQCMGLFGLLFLVVGLVIILKTGKK